MRSEGLGKWCNNPLTGSGKVLSYIREKTSNMG